MATILIIDDTPSEVALMKNVVESLGHSTLVATNGKAGVEMAERKQPDLVLLDIVMPEQDGFVSCRQIKRSVATQHIPVVLVSSKSGDSDKFWGLKQGASEYIAKPFSPDALSSVINRFLQN